MEDLSKKSKLYDSYLSTHLAGWKERPSIASFRERARGFDRLFGEFLPEDPKAKILDAGCGAGHLVWWLHERGYYASAGIDISAELVEMAGSLGLGEHVTKQDIAEHLSSARGYSRIFLRDVLEHLSYGQMFETLDLARRSLVDGGALIIQVPNGESPFFGRIRYGDLTHETAFTNRSLSQAFASTRFKSWKFYPVRPTFRGAKGMLRAPLWAVVESIYRLMLFAEVGRSPKIVTQNLLAVAWA